MRGISRFWFVPLVIGLSASAFAADDTAQSFMKDKQTELSGLEKKGGPENKKKIEGVFNTILDYDALALGALKDHRAELNDADWHEFEDTLKKLVQRSYQKNLDRTMDYDVQFSGETKDGDLVTVRTTAQSRTNAREEPISIDYVVHKVGGAYKITDIVTEGSSMVGNYHQQFNRIIKKDGFPELLKRMKKKLDKDEA
jgi:phospholipid transport system substrate-binding protein